MRTFWNDFNVLLFLVLLLVLSGSLHAKVKEDTPVHEVTLFAFPSMYPLDWQTPATLYKTATSCFYKTMSLEDNYLIGHMALRIQTPLLRQTQYIAMSSANKWERIDLILKDKIGLAILGATLQGKIESEEHVIHMLKVYAERKKLAYITFKVSEKSMNRMLDFIHQFTSADTSGHRPSAYYGGAYWPLYHQEGAGCSAFALAVLASAGLMPVQAESWLMNKNIPMNLIGGLYNKNKRIPFGRIKKTHAWHDGSATPNVDFVNVQTYEPSVLFQWILDKRYQNDSIFHSVEMEDVPGLAVDLTSAELPTEKPYFTRRPEPNLFLDIYQQILLKNAPKPTP